MYRQLNLPNMREVVDETYIDCFFPLQFGL
jgi:hypothetical protein